MVGTDGTPPVSVTSTVFVVQNLSGNIEVILGPHQIFQGEGTVKVILHIDLHQSDVDVGNTFADCL
jgi:hypothetical protein